MPSCLRQPAVSHIRVCFFSGGVSARAYSSSPVRNMAVFKCQTQRRHWSSLVTRRCVFKHAHTLAQPCMPAL